MEYSGIEHLDHFEDETICWVELSDPPTELRNKAVLIDGDNYIESCFGVCVAFDAKTRKFDLVVDMDGDEALTVYYLDNDGDKHWFAYDLPENLKKRIFSECQQILDFKKDNLGYEIRESIQFEDGSGFILAEKPASERRFATVHFIGADREQRYYGERRFFCYRNDAIKDFTEQVEQKKKFFPVKHVRPQAIKRWDKHKQTKRGRR